MAERDGRAGRCCTVTRLDQPATRAGRSGGNNALESPGSGPVTSRRTGRSRMPATRCTAGKPSARSGTERSTEGSGVLSHRSHSRATGGNPRTPRKTQTGRTTVGRPVGVEWPPPSPPADERRLTDRRSAATRGRHGRHEPGRSGTGRQETGPPAKRHRLPAAIQPDGAIAQSLAQGNSHQERNRKASRAGGGAGHEADQASPPGAAASGRLGALPPAGTSLR